MTDEDLTMLDNLFLVSADTIREGDSVLTGDYGWMTVTEVQIDPADGLVTTEDVVMIRGLVVGGDEDPVPHEEMFFASMDVTTWADAPPPAGPDENGAAVV